MSSTVDTAAERLSSVIDGIKCLKVRKIATGPDMMTFTCNWTDEARWYDIMSWFLLNERGWQSDFSKRYFKMTKDDQDTMVAGWRLIFRSSDISGAASRIASAFLRASAVVDGADPGDVAPVDFQLVEEFDIPLAFSDPSRSGRTKNGRGVASLAVQK